MKALAAALLLCLLALPAWPRPQLKIIQLQHRFAEDLLPALQPLAGPGGSVSAFGTQLIVNAEPAEIANIEQTARSLDIEQRNWRITVSHDARAWQSGRSAGVSGSAGRNPRIRVPGTTRRVSPGVEVGIEEHQRTWSQGGDMSLTVMDGAEAFLSVGQQIPYTGYWVGLTQRYARVEQTIEWREVSTGFVVRPRQIGDRVDLEIMPRLMQAGGSGAIDFAELATHVQVRPGEWLDLGGLMGRRDDVSRAILSQGGERQSGETALRIMVE
jgi:hypothetical protein